MNPTAPDTLRELVELLRQAVVSTAPIPATTASSPTPTAHPSPMAAPAPFGGEAENCNGFLLQCSLMFEMQPHRFPTDRAKIAYISSLLTNKALQWAEAIWQQDGSVVHDYDEFTTYFREVFTQPPLAKSCSNSNKVTVP